MLGKVDSSFQTEQRDLFASGVVAEIGVNAYAVWSAIKYHADFNTGHAWPGMRHLGDLIGLSKSAVSRAVDVLEKAHMLRVVKAANRRRGQTYIARERISVRLGDIVLCVVVIDYVPAQVRNRINRIEQALAVGEHDPDAFAEVEIIPGDGFVWDPASKVLRSKVPVRSIPAPIEDNDPAKQVGEAILKRLAPRLRGK